MGLAHEPFAACSCAALQPWGQAQLPCFSGKGGTSWNVLPHAEQAAKQHAHCSTSNLLHFSAPGNDRCAALAVGRERGFEQRPAHKAEGFVVHAAVAGLQQGAEQVLGGRKTKGATWQ